MIKAERGDAGTTTPTRSTEHRIMEIRVPNPHALRPIKDANISTTDRMLKKSKTSATKNRRLMTRKQTSITRRVTSPGGQLLATSKMAARRQILTLPTCS
jgi:hypothetical protein